MKMIKCYIQHEKLEAVRGKLFELGIPGITISDIKGIGKPMQQMNATQGQVVPQFHPGVEVTIVLENEAVTEVVETIIGVTRTGALSDGKIFILPLEDAIRIRTGQTGTQALY
jgi:nitrogen regulatory protein P-II 1